MKDCVTNIRWRILKETAHELQEDQRTLLPFWFFGVYESQTNIQTEAKIKIDFKLLHQCPYGCRRNHKQYMESMLDSNLWCQEKDCQLYDFEKRGHKRAKEKLRVIIKCPACFERIFPIGIDTPEHANYDDWVKKQYKSHQCPGQDESIIWRWIPEQNKETVERQNRKDAARARREKFMDIQKERKKAMTQGKAASEANSQLNRKYHTYKQVRMMNMTKEETAAHFKEKEKQSDSSKTAEADAQWTTNPLATPRQQEKRPHPDTPGTEEMKALNRQKGSGKDKFFGKGKVLPIAPATKEKGGRGSHISPTNLTEQMQSVAMEIAEADSDSEALKNL